MASKFAIASTFNYFGKLRIYLDKILANDICFMKFPNNFLSIRILQYTLWRETLVPLKFAKLTTDQKFTKFHHPNFYASIESHMNIEQIDWKVFLGHVSIYLRLGYHRSPLDNHGLWIVGISCFSFTK